MKISIIYVFPLLLIFCLSCNKQDSTIVNPEDSYEFYKKGGKDKPIEYEVTFTKTSLPDDVAESACLKTVYPWFGDADSKFFSVYFHGELRRSEAVMVEPVDQQGGTYQASGVNLHYDPNLIVTTNNNNEINSIRLYIKNGSRQDGGKMHKTDQIYLDPPEPINLAGFTLSIRDWFTIYEYSNFKGGKRLGRIGEIYINEIVYSLPLSE